MVAEFIPLVSLDTAMLGIDIIEREHDTFGRSEQLVIGRVSQPSHFRFVCRERGINSVKEIERSQLFGVGLVSG